MLKTSFWSMTIAKRQNITRIDMKRTLKKHKNDFCEMKIGKISM
jgi:hypothetical protein